MAKTGLYIAGFYLIYSIFLSKDTLYGRNRVFIILSIVAAFLLPLFTLPVNVHTDLSYFGKNLSDIVVSANKNTTGEISTSGESITKVPLIVRIYFIGIIITALKLVADVINLAILIIRRRNKKNHIIVFNGFKTSGFTAMGHIFINRSLSRDEADDIIKHEQNHLDRNHFLDILFIEIVKTFQWFNPVIYFFNRSIRAIHEFQADEGYLSSGIPVITYQNLLLCHVFKSGIFNISNSFSNPSLIKKRMIMMTKARSGYAANLKILLVIPVTAIVLFFLSSCKTSSKLSTSAYEKRPSPVFQNVKSKEIPLPLKEDRINIPESPDQAPQDIFIVVEEMPQFPGGESALYEFIYKNIQYPQSAKEQNIQGRVFVKFCIAYNGTVNRATVVKGVSSELDQEAVRVISMLPPFKPGRQKGKPVNAWFQMMVTFALK